MLDLPLSPGPIRQLMPSDGSHLKLLRHLKFSTSIFLITEDIRASLNQELKQFYSSHHREKRSIASGDQNRTRTGLAPLQIFTPLRFSPPPRGVCGLD